MKETIFAFALLIASVSAASAQVSFGGGAHSGLAFTSFPKPTNEFYGIGFGGGAHGDLNIMPTLAIRLNFDYNTFPSDKTKLKDTWFVTDPNGNRTSNFTVEGSNINIIGITANVVGKLSPHSSVRPYGLLGFGLQFTSRSDESVIANGRTIAQNRTLEGSTNFGMNFGSGLEFGLGRRTNLFFEAKYALIFASGGSSSYIPVTVGVSF